MNRGNVSRASDGGNLGSKRPVKVVYISGAGRSGTTLLDRLLGEIDGFVSIGEVRWLWWAYLETDWQCGCKRVLNQCPFWTTVMERLVGSPDVEPSLRHNLRLQQRTVRLHNLFRLLAQPNRGSHRWSELEQWISVMDSFYRIIADTAGASVIVDSSKNAPEAALLRMLPNVDPYILHLVRDPRGVANSWSRRVPMVPHTEGSIEHEVRGPLKSSAYWLYKNLASEVAPRRLGRAHARRIRYEDLVANPRRLLQEVAELVGEPFEGVTFTDAATVEFHESHTAWGNQFRFQVGPVELRADEKWRRQLAPRARRATVAACLPLMLRYGYRLRTDIPARPDARLDRGREIPSADSKEQ